MKYYAVIDTNVFVSALLKRASVPGNVAAHVLTGNIIPLLNDAIMSEYREVLSRAKFHFPEEAVKVFLQGIGDRGVYMDTGSTEYVLPDPKDAVFYEVVMEARKERDSYLVTGNIKHFPIRTFVVTPREMLDIIECSEGGNKRTV